MNRNRKQESITKVRWIGRRDFGGVVMRGEDERGDTYLTYRSRADARYPAGFRAVTVEAHASGRVRVTTWVRGRNEKDELCDSILYKKVVDAVRVIAAHLRGRYLGGYVG